MAFATQRARPLVVVVMTMAVLGVFSACGNEPTGLENELPARAADVVADAPADVVSARNSWTRIPPPGQTTAAVYAVIANRTDDDRRIVGVTRSLTGRAELHETLIGPKGIAVMRPGDVGFTLPAGAALLFEPGGAHVMLRDIDRNELGRTIDITLELDDGDELAVEVEVRGNLATAGGNDEGMVVSPLATKPR